MTVIGSLEFFAVTVCDDCDGPPLQTILARHSGRLFRRFLLCIRGVTVTVEPGSAVPLTVSSFLIGSTVGAVV